MALAVAVLMGPPTAASGAYMSGRESAGVPWGSIAAPTEKPLVTHAANSGLPGPADFTKAWVQFDFPQINLTIETRSLNQQGKEPCDWAGLVELRDFDRNASFRLQWSTRSTPPPLRSSSQVNMGNPPSRQGGEWMAANGTPGLLRFSFSGHPWGDVGLSRAYQFDATLSCGDAKDEVSVLHKPRLLANLSASASCAAIVMSVALLRRGRL